MGRRPSSSAITFLILLLSGLPHRSVGRRSTIDAFTRSKTNVSTEDGNAKAPVLIRLNRRFARTSRASASVMRTQGGPASSSPSSAASSARSFFVGTVHMGQPTQKLRVSFDSASGQVLFPSSACNGPACSEHWRYAPELSTTAVDLNADGAASAGGNRDAVTVSLSSMSLGNGEAIGYLMRDRLCFRDSAVNDTLLDPLGDTILARQACAHVGMVSAVHQSVRPFRALPHDGIIGLSLRGLSIGSGFNFLDRITESLSLPPQFGIQLSDWTGQLTIGGHRIPELTRPMVWSPVFRADEGYWQLEFRSVRIGNDTLSVCASGGCRGIVDTGASALGVPTSMLPDIVAALGPEAYRSQACDGRSIVFEIEAGNTLELGPEDYRRTVSRAGPECGLPQISPLDLPEAFAKVFVLGEPFLRRYYVAFDAASPPQLGFGDILEKSPYFPVDVEEARLTLTSEALISRSKAENDDLGDWLQQGWILCLLVTTTALILRAVFLGPVLGQYGRAFPDFGFDQLGKIVVFTGLVTKRVKLSEVKSCCEECPICLGDCEEQCAKLESCCDTATSRTSSDSWVRLECRHTFHEHCIKRWLYKSPRCPVCRAHVLDKVSLSRLLLNFAPSRPTKHAVRPEQRASPGTC